MPINKRYIVDEQGNPKEAVEQLHQARIDRESGNKDAYLTLTLHKYCRQKPFHSRYSA